MPAGPGSSLILVVEGERLARQTLVGEFQLAGWEILQAETGEDAIARIRDVGDWMEIVFTDIELPGRLNGWDVADAARALYPELPIIYVSSRATEVLRQVPDSHFFRKPCKASAILAACVRFQRLGYGRPDRRSVH